MQVVPQFGFSSLTTTQLSARDFAGSLLFNRTSWSSPKRRMDAKPSSNFVFIALTSQ